MAGVPNDPDRIDISLDLIGGQSFEAVRTLTEQLSTVSEYLANFQNTSAVGSALGQNRVANAMVNRTGKVYQDGTHPHSSHAGRSTPLQDNAGAFASDAALIQQGNQGFLRRLRQGGFRGLAERELSIYGAQERQQTTRRGGQGFGGLDPSYAPIFGEQYQGGVDQEMNRRGGVSEGASAPDPTDPIWRQSAQSNRVDWERMQEGFRLPPGGLSLNFQQKMEIGADFLQRRAERRYQQERLSRQQAALADAQQAAAASEPGQLSMFGPTNEAEALTPEDMNVNMQDVSSRTGLAGGALRLASQQSGVIQLASDARAHLARGYGYAGAVQQAGTQAGFARGGTVNIPGTNIGFMNPFNSAMREGLRQRINVQRLRLMGGISGSQANEIVTGLAGSGWTGSQGQNIAFDAIAPLVQQGQNPGLAVQSFDQVMRQGNASMTDFVDTMSNLGESAHAARMSLDEYQQGLSQFAETAQGLGASGTQGTRLGRSMTDALGVAPQVAGEMIQAPLYQGLALQQGFLPNEVGLMHGQQAVSTTYQAIDMAMRATAGFANRPIHTANGTISGRDRQIAQVASILGPGYSTDVVKRLLRQRNFSTNAGQAEGQLSRLHDMLGAVNEVQGSGTDKTIQLGGRGAPAITVHSKGNGLNDKEQAGADSALNRQWYQVLGTLRKGAPDAKTDPHGYAKYMTEVGDLSKGDNKERIAAATKFIRDHSQSKQTDPERTVYVRFKGAAAKFFESDNTANSKKTANSGGATIADQLAALPTQRAQKEFLSDYLKNESGGMFGG